MKRTIKRIIALLLYTTGIGRILFRLQFASRRNILVLLYHRIKVPGDLFEAAVSPENFERQMRFIQRHFRVVPVAEALTMRERKEIPPGKPLAVITFDDGYKDNLEVAHPVLKKYSLPATFFVTVGSIGNVEPMWTSCVEAMHRNARVDEFTLERLSPSRVFKLGVGAARMKVCFEVKNEMKKMPDSKREIVFAELQEKLGHEISGKDEIYSEMLSWDDVRRMAKDALIEIGSHSMSHKMLANVSPETMSHELEESKRRIESEIGKTVRFVSYPGNSHNAEVWSAAKAAGYEAAFAVDQSLCSFQEDVFCLRRIHVEDEPLYVFQAEISCALQMFRKVGTWPWH